MLSFNYKFFNLAFDKVIIYISFKQLHGTVTPCDFVDYHLS